MLHRRKTEIVQVNLRLREELRLRLAKEADKAGRSFNAEIVRRIEQSFVHEELADVVVKSVAEGFKGVRGGLLGITETEWAEIEKRRRK